MSRSSAWACAPRPLSQIGILTMQPDISEFGKADLAAAEETRPAHAGTRVFQAVDTALARLTEMAAAALVVAEVLVLGASTGARYLFAKPFAWSDELASILFLWLSMLGAVIALRRGEHMRMTGILPYAGPRLRGFLETMAVMAPLALLLLILHPAFDYASEERFIVTPALEISNAWRAAAIPVGVTLMALSAAFRLAQRHSWPLIAAALITTVVLLAAFWFAGPSLAP